jgi:predicted DNA binding protein
MADISKHVIQLEFSTNAETWILSLCKTKLARIKVMSLKALDGTNKLITHFVDISSQKASAQDLTRALEKAPDVTDSDLARVAPNRVVGSVTSNDCLVCQAVVESNTNCFIAPAATEEDCNMNYKLFISGGGLPLFLQRLHRKGVNYKIEDLSPLTSPRGITARQQNVLRSALELGYYDFPKRVSTEELANKMGIKSGTVVEILRRAEKNVISRYFDEES